MKNGEVNRPRSYQERALPAELCGHWFHYVAFYSLLSSPNSIIFKLWWRGQDSNLRSPSGRQIYSLLRLTAPAPLPVPLSHTQPERGLEPTNLPIRAGVTPLKHEPERGLEPADLPFTKRLLFQLSYSGTIFTNFGNIRNNIS